MFRNLLVVVGGPACALLVGLTFIPAGQPGTNSAFVLAVLIAVIVSGLWWGIAAACISTVLITYFFVEPRGPHLNAEAIPVIGVFAATVVLAAVLARSLSSARDRATASLAERELVLKELDRQMERERAASRAFQSAALQDVLPTVESATLEAFYQPALSLYEIGGDWYDVLAHHDGRVTVTVGDICGKGIDAAAEMVRVSKALRIYAAEGYSPGQVLARVDTAMLDGTLREVFTTAVCATYDPSSMTVEYATAGHPPPLLVRAAGGAELLDQCNNPPLTTGTVRSSTETVHLAEGDTLYFYTDGLIERRNRTLDEGLFELARACTTPRGTTCSLEEIVSAVTADSAPEDDLCLVRLSIAEASALASAPSVASAARTAVPR